MSQEREAVTIPEDWHAPPPELRHYRLAKIFGWNEREIKGTTQQWATDLLTCERWATWVDNRLFQDAQDESQSEQQQPSGPRRLSRGQINAQRSRIPVPDGMSDEELAAFMGVEMLPDA